MAPYKESPFNSIEADNVLRMVRSDFGKVDPEAEIAAAVAKRDALVAEIRAIAGIDPASPAFPDTAPANGLVAHLAFEDAKAAQAVNAAPDGKPASVRDAGFEAEGRIGKAFRFDGGDDRVEIQRPVGDDFTIAFFFKTTDLAVGTAAGSSARASSTPKCPESCAISASR
ncbi:MAG: hypothetical protein ACK5C3_04530 [bacterium]